MPKTIGQPMFSAAQQAMRARLAAMNPTQFAALKGLLEQASAATDVRLAQIEAEKAQLTARKAKLGNVLNRLATPNALDTLRTAVVGGRSLVANVSPTAVSGVTKPGKKKPGKKKPGK